VVWVPEELTPHQWIDAKDHPTPRKSWYVKCTVTKDFKWHGMLLWNLGHWQIPKDHLRPEDYHMHGDFFMVPMDAEQGEPKAFSFQDITHYHWWGLKGEKQPRQILLVPIDNIKGKRDTQ